MLARYNVLQLPFFGPSPFIYSCLLIMSAIYLFENKFENAEMQQ